MPTLFHDTLQLAHSKPPLRRTLLPLIRKVAAKWKKLPKGWTEESVKKFWASMAGDVKHKVTKCMERMDGKISNPGAFCASLRDRVEGKEWRSERTASQARQANTRMIVRHPQAHNAWLVFNIVPIVSNAGAGWLQEELYSTTAQHKLEIHLLSNWEHLVSTSHPNGHSMVAEIKEFIVVLHRKFKIKVVHGISADLPEETLQFGIWSNKGSPPSGVVLTAGPRATYTWAQVVTNYWASIFGRATPAAKGWLDRGPTEWVWENLA